MKQFYSFLLVALLSVTCFAQSDVTFSVDMSGVSAQYTAVYVSGEFNGWSGDSNPLTDQGNGIWEATLSIPDGEYEYKFTMDNWAQQESFTVGDVCTVTNSGNSNRILNFVGDTVIPTAPFNVCVESLTNPGPHDVTFNLDMSGYTGTFTTPHVSGQINGWSGDSNPMTDMGIGIWTATLTFTEGQSEFKFSLDNWTDQENFTDGDIGTVSNGGFTNRYIIADETKTLNFAWAQPGTLSLDREFSVNSFSIYPNPTTDLWNISSDVQKITAVQIYSLDGKQVYANDSLNSELVSISSSELNSGIYIARISTTAGVNTLQLAKK